MSKNTDVVLFNDNTGKEITFNDILKKIWDVNENKRNHILNTVNELAPRITTVQDAVVLMPHLISLQEVSVKNDDQLVKMAAIVQRNMKKIKNKDDDDDFSITAEERSMLLKQARANSIPGSSIED